MNALLAFVASLLLSAVPPPSDSAPGLECRAPRTLELRRFEDGSARLECAGRALVRVHVPG